MGARVWNIAILGTFDVENYGDLLFPLIAAHELRARLGDVRLRPFSYHARHAPQWPYDVTSVGDLPALAEQLDGMLIGGGFIVRFDKFVAPGYGPPEPSIHHPTGYWLTPALIAIQQGIPLVWNAPGMHCNDLPAWAHPLLRLVFDQSRYIAVRDAPSRESLAPFAPTGHVVEMHDTAFGLARCIDATMPSHGFVRVRDAAALGERYVVVQPAYCLDAFVAHVRRHAPELCGVRFLVLPIGPVLGDDVSRLGPLPEGFVQLEHWPDPLLLAEIISHASGVVGHSYHLAVSAIAFGVPVFSSAHLDVGKFRALQPFERVHGLPPAPDDDPHWLASRLGRGPASAAARAARERLATHWDAIATAIRAGRTVSAVAANRFWQALPTLLEQAALATADAVLSAERVDPADVPATGGNRDVDDPAVEAAPCAVESAACSTRFDLPAATTDTRLLDRMADLNRDIGRARTDLQALTHAWRRSAGRGGGT